MKPFQFRLERVLSWRQSQARLEEGTLEGLRGQLRALDQQRAALAQSVEGEQTRLLEARTLTAAEIGALEHYRSASRRQQAQLGQLRQTLEQKVAHQMQAVLQRRREARLLERLRQRRLEEWQVAAAREEEQVAMESHLARLVREPR